MESPLLQTEFEPSSSTSNLLVLQGSPAGTHYSPQFCDGLLSPTQSRPVSPSPYANSLSDMYALKPNPAEWGSAALTMGTPEPDDDLHNPDPRRDLKNDRGGHIFTARGIANLGCLFILAAALIFTFFGLPILTHLLTKKQTTQGGYNLGGINATGQIPFMSGNWGLIDTDTPKDAYTKASFMNPGDSWELVFSDESSTEGRSFYPGDDPYWEAPNLHYWGTNDLEWYDPSAVTTKGGALAITLSKVDPATNHNLTYKSGMVQSWNKFCFTGGLIEIVLPGSNNVHGLWPAIWTMGNLGRAGFGASLDGLWPYSYDSCDVGTLPNQTFPGTQTPLAATENGDPDHGGVLSYLPGQRLSACTCPGESHPGPVHSNGSYVGRAAPEIDIFEATVDGGVGKVSQSAQWAPFNASPNSVGAAYQWSNTSDNFKIYDPTITVLNSYHGGVYQETTSGLSLTNQDCYELDTGCYSVYGFEYVPGFDNGYITWISDSKPVWTVMAAGIGPDPLTDIGARPIPQEAMYIIANLGFSTNFGGIDFESIQLPATMLIDYIRVYQPANAKNIGCDPLEFPTAAYINTYMEAYTNFNLTTWAQFNQTNPKNRLVDNC